MWWFLICVQSVMFASKTIYCRSEDDVGEPLFITPLLEKGLVERAQELSLVRPEIGNMKSYTGFFTVNKECETNLFFWYFPAQKNSQQAPVLLYLLGGPGVSSLYSLFTEMGPFEIKKGSVLSRRKLSWNVKNNLLFIDQPVGTGFSFSGKGCYNTNTTVGGEELYSAMVQFYKLFPKLVSNRFLITGVSFAAQYISALGYTIHTNNPSANVKINLRGMIICTGWMDAYYQTMNYDYLYQIGLLDHEGRAAYKNRHRELSKRIIKQEWQAVLEIRESFVNELYTTYVGNISHLNFLNTTGLIPAPYVDLIQTPEMRKAIHVGNTTYNFENPQVKKSLGVYTVKSVKPWIEELLEHYFIVFQGGQLDIVCAYPMQVKLLKALNWSGKKSFQKAKRHKWCVNQQQAGAFKKGHNICDVFVRNAGHLSTRDQPEWMYELINAVTSGPQGDPCKYLNGC